MNAAQWALRLEELLPGDVRVLEKVYGTASGVVRQRARLLHSVVEAFLQRFGDRELRIFRSPGRINLRGMHVDTHGGYVNLMTHQRETVVAAALAEEDTSIVENLDAAFPEVVFCGAEAAARPSFRGPWENFITHPDTQREVEAHQGDWGNYVRGSILSAQYRAPPGALLGIEAVVGSDLPRGAALSSSASLCTALIHALLGWNDLVLDPHRLIRIAQDAEWYTGARTGLSDQGAMALGGVNEVVSVILSEDGVAVEEVGRAVLPDGLGVLVANSFTERNLSGNAFFDYVRNRFAYSVALDVFRQELRGMNVPEEAVEGFNGLGRITREAVEALSGVTSLYALLKRVPATMGLEEIRKRYASPNLEAAHARYFGKLPEAIRGQNVALRGPLLYGIAESERARIFLDTLAEGDVEKAGRLMNAGHDGDRKVARDGSPFVHDLSDQAMDRLTENGTPLWECPGAYGASSPVLDALVDTALDAGALGASLTGAGIAGSVLALCRTEDLQAVADALRQRSASEEYAAMAKLDRVLDEEELAAAVSLNRATSAAGELVLEE